MSFLSKALRKAEVFLEQVDESVAQAGRRAVVEGATADFDGDEDSGWVPTADDPLAAGVVEPDAFAEVEPDAGVRGSAQRRRGVGNIRSSRIRPRGGETESGMGAVRANDAVADDGVVAPPPNADAVQSSFRDQALETGPDWGDLGGGMDGDVDGWRELDVPDVDGGAGPVDPAMQQANGVRERGVVGGSPAALTPDEPMRNSAVASVPSAGERVGMASVQRGGDGEFFARERKSSSAVEKDLSEDYVSSAIEVKQRDGTPPVLQADTSNFGESLVAGGAETASASVTGTSATQSLSPPTEPKTSSSPLSAALPHSRVPERETSRQVQAGGRLEPRVVPPSVVEPASPVRHAANETSADGELGAAIEENEELRSELELAEEDFDNLLKERAKHIQNLKRLKAVIADQEETVEEKSAEARRLGGELANLRDEKTKLQKALRGAHAKGKDALDLLRKNLSSQIEKLEADCKATKGEEARLRTENASIKEALTQGREEDMLTADGAREQASKAQAAYEAEVAAHRETRESLKSHQEILDAEAASTAEAIAAAQRKADDALAAASAAKEAQRSAESRLTRLATARDAALARVEDLTKELAPYLDAEGANLAGHGELESLQQTVVELENALEAKNVELTRLEGDVENMRSVINRRCDSAGPRSPGGAVVGAGGEFSNGREVEQKLRHMADSALRKQAQIEVLRSENKALQHQLDTERKRTREAQAMAAVATSSRHNLRGGFRGMDDAERGGDRAYGARDGPLARFRAPRSWPAVLVRGLAEFDRFAARSLAFLRREPLLRMAIVVYIVCVHFLLYGLLHYHTEQAINDPAATSIHAHAHPREPLVKQ